jgi:hypothetical protein
VWELANSAATVRMAELDRYSKLLHEVEHLVNYARVKHTLLRSKAWVPQSTFEAVVAALPSASETEKRLLGEALGKIVASAVAKSARSSGEFPGLFISYLALRALERVLRKDSLDWRIAAYTRGDSLAPTIGASTISVCVSIPVRGNHWRAKAFMRDS